MWPLFFFRDSRRDWLWSMRHEPQPIPAGEQTSHSRGYRSARSKLVPLHATGMEMNKSSLDIEFGENACELH